MHITFLRCRAIEMPELRKRRGYALMVLATKYFFIKHNVKNLKMTTGENVVHNKETTVWK